jgi:hypothetical protein
MLDSDEKYDNPDGKKQLERSAHVWRGNIARQVEATGRQDVDWIQLAQGREHNNELSDFPQRPVECKLM